MGLRRFKLYGSRVTAIGARLLLARGGGRAPLDRVGLVCLAWAGAFFCLTAVVVLVLR